MRVAREVTGLATVIVIVALVDNIASALSELGNVDLAAGSLASYVIPLLLRHNIVLYALGGVLAIALVWKLSSYLEELVARSLERG